jgi:hypothetical protein
MPHDISYGKIISIFLAKSIYAMNLLRWQIIAKLQINLQIVQSSLQF